MVVYQEFKTTGFASAQENSEDKVWYPSGINTGCFSTVAANAMLKSIEEPNSNVTFIFLTNNKDDLLQTIVSRSQAFSMPDAKNFEYETEFFKKFFNTYPNFNKEIALDFAQCLLNYQNDNNVEAKYVLDCIQYYLLQIAKSNSNNQVLTNKIFKDIEKIQSSKKMIDAYIKEQTVYEDLAFYFIKR